MNLYLQVHANLFDICTNSYKFVYKLPLRGELQSTQELFKVSFCSFRIFFKNFIAKTIFEAFCGILLLKFILLHFSTVDDRQIFPKTFFYNKHRTPPTFESIDCIPISKIKTAAVVTDKRHKNPRGRLDPVIAEE